MNSKYGKINNFETGEVEEELVTMPLMFTKNRKDFDKKYQKNFELDFIQDTQFDEIPKPQKSL
jgi:hypothetical protein